MIRTIGLTRRFKTRKRGEFEAVSDVDLTCRDGEIYALLGPNGAGKTTLLRMLSTLLTPTAGEAYVNQWSVESDSMQVRKLIGIVSYETRVYERMTPREIGYFFGRLNDLPDREIAVNLERAFGLLGMEEFADELTDGFSTGMKQKTVLMRALITDPEILIFDEPTAGLDLLTARSVTNYIRRLRDQGKTILFSTHILWEAERLADTIGIMDDGRVIAQGSLEELSARSGRRDIEDIFFYFVQEPELAAA